MTKTIAFGGKQYAHQYAPGIDPNKVIILSNDSGPVLSGPQLVELYNLVSANLGRGRVQRFSTPAVGVKRTWAILEEYDAQGPAGFEEASEEELSKQKGRVKSEAKPKAQLSDTEKAGIKEEAQSRKASAPTTVERWRTPKRREPSKRCYMPRPGSKQDVAYQLLTQEGGIRVEDLCAQMSKLDTSGKNSTEWKEPGTIWGSLNYLFVTQKGYGLDFDGERIRLLKGKEEVAFSSTKKA